MVWGFRVLLMTIRLAVFLGFAVLLLERHCDPEDLVHLILGKPLESSLKRF